jgi:twinkle protein
MYDWFAGRGISRETVDAFGVFMTRVWFPQTGTEEWATASPYRKDGLVVNHKYRAAAAKHFRQDKDAARTFFNLEGLVDNDEAIVGEGEIDSMSWAEAGLWNAITGPDGAPGKFRWEGGDPKCRVHADPKKPLTDPAVLVCAGCGAHQVEEPDPDDRRFEPLRTCEDELAHIERFYIATDMDGPGRVLAEEYARRLGKERCYRITFPDGYKDPNEVLNGSKSKGLPALGAAALLEAKAAAAPYPVKGLLRIEPGTLAALRGKGRYIGIEIAPEWPLFCEHYKPNTGQLTVVSGYPGSGKSELIDAIAVHLAARHGWKFAVCSPENPPDVHTSKLAEKYIGKQFWADSETLWTDLMSETEMTEAEDWVRAHFTFIVNDDDADLITFDYLLERARIAVRRFGVKGLIIDPYNDFDRPTDMNETEFVRRMLSRVRRFNAVCDVHTWLAAHPAKVQRNRDGEVWQQVPEIG